VVAVGAVDRPAQRDAVASGGHRPLPAQLDAVDGHLSAGEHATTPEHPCPGVVARTGPQAVKPSPVSGESMASGGCACGRASHHQPHRGTPPTLPALQREVATDPRWPVTAASGPGAPSSPGPHPNRAGGVDQPGPWGRWPTRRCAAEQHLTTDLLENASGAAGVTANGDLRRRKRPRGPPSRGRSSSTYQQERLADCSRYIGSQTMPAASYVVVVKRGAKRPPPFDP
jgi:hypothetical protein